MAMKSSRWSLGSGVVNWQWDGRIIRRWNLLGALAAQEYFSGRLELSGVFLALVVAPGVRKNVIEF